MKDNEFSQLLEEKITSLADRKKTITTNLLDGSWHTAQVKTALDRALDELEGMSETKELNVEKELESIIMQVPGLVQNIWTTAIASADDIEEQISRWKEMSGYYTQFIENKKEEEYHKKEEEQRKKEEEKAEEEQIAKIASGELEEPTRMEAIRRPVGTRPRETISRFRKLAAKANNEETTDADDSRG